MTAPVWNTPVGSIGIFPSETPVVYTFSASPVTPATSVTYILLSGSIPVGLTLSSSGLLSGTPALLSKQTSYNFAIRATDNLSRIQDRTFSITIAAAGSPVFTTPAGSILSTNDSVWTELQIEYSNPISTNTVLISVAQGQLPPGLEINEFGLIRGYPNPPTTEVTYEAIVTYATNTSSTDNSITVGSTSGIVVGREVTFSGAGLANISTGVVYYVQSVIDQTRFTISQTQFGPVYPITTSTGFLTVTLPSTTMGQPTVRTYTFSLSLTSVLGSDLQTYYITVTNQNYNGSQNTRVPTILNTRPASYNISANPETYAYYILPPNSNGVTYLPSQNAYIGQISSGEFFAFQMLGYDFDGNAITYVYNSLPPGMTGDPVTGWITGTPTVALDTINQYDFSVRVHKSYINSYITSPTVNFSLLISNEVNGEVTWITPSDLGQISNSKVSTLSVLAECDVPLLYKMAGGSLPPNLVLQSNGDIVGTVAFEPGTTLYQPGTTSTYTFSVEVYSLNYPIVQSTKTFTLNVYQEFAQPTDTLYITAAPPITQRYVLEGLITNTEIIPPEAVYRPNDPNFGVATTVNYIHAYGIYASNFDQYVAAVTKNHYWRYITLGEIKTAVAKDENGEVIYEVVYSEVIDNLINPEGVSVSEVIEWPRPINLFLGPWYSSVTNIYSSYIFPNSNSLPTYYTSLDSGHAQELYPNSLVNMRKRVGQTLGQEYNSNVLPLWMTSQQANGGTLGFTPAWVICYTKPGFSEQIASNIQTLWVNEANVPYSLNQINFEIDRFTVGKTLTYNYDDLLDPPAWTSLPSATPVPNPTDSKDFYILFPRQTILPNR